MTRLCRWFQFALATLTMGAVFDLGTGCASTLLHNVNPCGTILNCNPIEYDLAVHGSETDYSYDPTCTIPGFCGGTPFAPTSGQGNPAQSGSDIGTGSGAISNTTGTGLGTTTGTTTGTGVGT